jgi:hypothetical protein
MACISSKEGGCHMPDGLEPGNEEGLIDKTTTTGNPSATTALQAMIFVENLKITMPVKPLL